MKLQKSDGEELWEASEKPWLKKLVHFHRSLQRIEKNHGDLQQIFRKSVNL